MIETIPDLPAGIDGLRASGKLTREDYQAVVEPLVARAATTGQRLRCLVEIPDFGGITSEAAFEDLALGRRVLHAFDGCAVVTDLPWLAGMTRFAAFFTPYPVRVFPFEERAAAITWLQELPGASHLRIRVADDTVVVEADGPLRVGDVAELAAVVDRHLAEHPTLHAVVLHAAAVPGWENFAALRAHLQFVARHHRRIDRIAVAVDGTVAAAAAGLAGLITHPRTRHFAHDELDAAIAWAAAGRARAA